MRYELLKDVITLIEEFESTRKEAGWTEDVLGFKGWLCRQHKREEAAVSPPDWEGKAEGRSAESVISTMLVHLNRYARIYARAAMTSSSFSTQEEFIYLINLNVFGPMTKMDLIKRNIQDKPTGMQIISRLIKQGWVSQSNSEVDRRSKVISITLTGKKALEAQMPKIRQATQIVVGNLSTGEKLELIRLLSKLDRFHHPIFLANMDQETLLDSVMKQYGLTEQKKKDI
mgnify:CR=1 FL=1